MSRITQRGQGGPLELFQVSSDPSLATLVGAQFSSGDGRDYVLVQNAGTALAPGKLVMGPKPIANHQNLATSTASAGATSITVTSGGTLITANQYAGGLLVVNAGTGAGQTLKIASHPAASASGTCVLTLEDAVNVATSSSDTKSCLRLNPFGSANGTDVRTSGVIVVDHTAPTGQLVGIPTYTIAASSATVPSYGLVQTRGSVSCLNDANTAVGASGGLDVMPSANTDGAVATYVVATGSRIGTSVQSGVTTEYRQIVIQL